MTTIKPTGQGGPHRGQGRKPSPYLIKVVKLAFKNEQEYRQYLKLNTRRRVTLAMNEELQNMGDTENALNDYFMSNIDECDRSAAEQAAKETNMPIVIKDEATDIWGNIVPNNVAVYATSNADHGEFWRRFRELKLTT